MRPNGLKKVDPFRSTIETPLSMSEELKSVDHVPRKLLIPLYFFMKEEGGLDGSVKITNYVLLLNSGVDQ